MAWARNLRTVLNRSGECEQPCIVPEFGGSGFSFSPLSMMLAIVLSYTVLVMLSYIPSICNFLRALIMKWCWVLSKSFYASVEMFMWILYLLLLICYITFIDLYMLNDPWIPGMMPTLSWWMTHIFLIWYRIWFAIILLRIFAPIFIKDIVL
jgi:hypothetical protein